MRSVSLAAAKAGLSALLDAVEAGEEVRITRRSKTVARLVPDDTPAAADTWAQRLRQFQQAQHDQPPLPDSAVALVPDSGSSAALHWLASQHSGPIWLSHWTWLEFTGVLAVCCRRGDMTTERLRAIHGEADALRRERLSLVEPSSVDQALLNGAQSLDCGELVLLI